MSNPHPIKAPPWWEMVDNFVQPDRVQVVSFGTADRVSVIIGGIRLVCTKEQWQELNAAVDAGFASLVRRTIPLPRRGNPTPNDAA